MGRPGRVTGADPKTRHRGTTTRGRRRSPAVDRFVHCVTAQVGKPYVWATAGPDTFDCSGLVAYCYDAATGHAITHSSHAQYRLGRRVSANRGHLAPGDLVFYDTNGDGAGHVGIVVGPDRAVHALNPALGVAETGIKRATLGGPYLGARRLAGLDAALPHPLSAHARHTRQDDHRVARTQRREHGATDRRDAPLDGLDEGNPIVEDTSGALVGPGHDCLNDPFVLVPAHDGVGCAARTPVPQTPEDPLDG